ncbi:MAG: hypothetical protein ACTSPI_09440 [Candidatus Heimdallarchaeaceae archaeon]
MDSNLYHCIHCGQVFSRDYFNHQPTPEYAGCSENICIECEERLILCPSCGEGDVPIEDKGLLGGVFTIVGAGEERVGLRCRCGHMFGVHECDLT